MLVGEELSGNDDFDCNGPVPLQDTDYLRAYLIEKKVVTPGEWYHFDNCKEFFALRCS